MRALKSTLFLTVALCLCFAGVASGQDVIVYVADDNGSAIPDATVTAHVNGTAFIAPITGHGQYNVPVDDTKALLTVEHPSFGSQTSEVILPESGTEILAVFVSDAGMRTKLLSIGRLNDFFSLSELGNPVIPPPGQGCQLPDQLGHGGGGIIAATSDVDTGFSVSDDFCPEDDGFVTHAVWWGSMFDFGIGADCSPSSDNFTINYYDDGGACPGALIASFPSIGLAQKFFTGNVIAGFLNEYQYQSAFHAPVAVVAGNKYWLEIVNDTSGDGNLNCAWLWNTAPPDPGSSCQNGAPTDFNQAFCVSVLTAPCPGPPAPANDECDGCEAISGEGPHAFDNTLATTGTFDQANILCDEFGSTSVDNDVWFCWTASADCDVTVSTCAGTAVDTKIAIYDGADCNTAAMVDCNDDTCGLQSEVTATVVAGNTYLIRIGTFPGAAGGVGTFTVTCGGGGGPANDDCANAEAVAIGGTATGTTIGAAADGLAFCGTSEGTGGTVWYSVIGNGNSLSASFCQGGGTADYDTKMQVWCGACLGACVDGNDDTCGLQSEVTWDAADGQEYLIAVTGFSSGNGNFTLAIVDNGAGGTPVACTALTYDDVTIGSNLQGVFVQVDPMDVYLLTAGLTPFDRTFDQGTQVSVTAPTNWNGNTLIGWLVDGRIVRPNGGTLTGTSSEATHVKAVYSDGTTQDGGILHRR